jgi:hypothetical protein
MKTMRFGVQLPTGIHTQANGNVSLPMSVSGMANSTTSFYQVDPANGRVYFTAENENRSVSITYTPVDPETGNALPPRTYPNPAIGEPPVTVTMITERAEVPVPIEQAVNESQLYSFIDPLDSTSDANRRPGLVWMFYTSTRAGGPDIYFQTIAPRLTPVATNRGSR